MNNSSTGGYILPSPIGPEPIEDDELHDFMQGVVVGTTGLPGPLVRPRWQPEPPDIPDFGVSWAAIGEVNRDVDGYATLLHQCENDLDPPGNGYDIFHRNEVIELLCTFYGPKANKYAGLLRDGLQLGQNREVMLLNGFGLVNTGNPVEVPELIKERWLYRVDQPFIVRRLVLRRYDNLNVLSAPTVYTTQR
jgi:hypothetical protein